MSPTSAIRGVLFDYGGVLTTPVGDSIAAWLAADRIEPETFSTTLKGWLSRDVEWSTPIHQLETGGLTAVEFEHVLAAELRTVEGGAVEAEGLLTRLFAGMRPDPEMFGLAEELRDAGISVGLLSNSWGKLYPHDLLEPIFRPIVISEEVRMRKPQPEIYLHSLSLMGLAAEEVAFIDDAEPNVIGARRVGLHGIHHRSAAETRAALGELLGPRYARFAGYSTEEEGAS